MLDINATIRWATAVIQSPDQAAADYKATAAPHMQTFMVLPLPLYVASYLVAIILATILGGSVGFGEHSIVGGIVAMAFALGWTFVVAFVFDFFAGTFGGQKNFDHAYAVVGLAIVPGALGTVLGALPWIGWLLSLAASIYMLVLAYQFIPVFLGVPEESRTKHFALSCVTLLVAGLVFSMIIGTFFAGAVVSDKVFSGSADDAGSLSATDSGSAGAGGFLGGLERAGKVMEEAEKDRYSPPDDGMLSDDQVQTYIRNMRKTKELRERLTSKYEGMGEKDDASISDIFGGISDMSRVGTAEAEVVKTSGGNWAEHQWVKSALETARVQQDINDAVAHNYALFMKYQDEIEALD
ncbi:MAG: Yip1 family protein [Pseudomonadales bacterium]